jgi:ribosome biogenesis GTPase A
VIGRTKSGKSTLCNLLAKEKLVSYLDFRDILLKTKNENPMFKIGEKPNSETTIPNI